jgi:phytoene synthase
MGLQTWEIPLLARAYEGFHSEIESRSFDTDDTILKNAYRYCKQVTVDNSKTFYLASILLPPDRRSAIHALYAFCRSTDDLVDRFSGNADVTEVFAAWRKRIMIDSPTAYDPVPLAWADTQTRYDIPSVYADQLIDGIARDMTQNRYESFNQLTEYCYGVASTVGLMTLHILRSQGEAAIPYAIKLGVALQLTNILRDVGEDWRAGRLYPPLEELEEFGLGESDIATGQVNDRWRALMRFQINRNRVLYKEAEEGIALLNPEGRFAVSAAAVLYSGILNDIEAQDYDVFHRRAHLGWKGKIKRLPGAWWNSR